MFTLSTEYVSSPTTWGDAPDNGQERYWHRTTRIESRFLYSEVCLRIPYLVSEVYPIIQELESYRAEVSLPGIVQYAEYILSPRDAPTAQAIIRFKSQYPFDNWVEWIPELKEMIHEFAHMCSPPMYEWVLNE